MVAADLTPHVAKEEGLAAKREGGKAGGKLAGRGRAKIGLSPIGDKPNGRANKSSEKAAATVGTSGRQTQRAIAVKRAAPDVASKVKAGELNLHQAEREVKRREKTAQLQAKAAAGATWW